MQQKTKNKEEYDPLEKYMEKNGGVKQHRASYFRRALAFVFDILLVDIIVFWPFEAVVKGILPSENIKEAMTFLVANPAAYTKLSGIIFIMGMLALAYFALMEYAMGQTLGKILFRLRVVQTRPDYADFRSHNYADLKRKHLPMKSCSENPGLFQCITRNIFVIPAFPVILLWIIDPAYLFFNAKGQRLTEFLSNTMVIEEPFELERKP